MRSALTVAGRNRRAVGIPAVALVLVEEPRKLPGLPLPAWGLCFLRTCAASSCHDLPPCACSSVRPTHTLSLSFFLEAVGAET
jgi:hypothetical protein